MVNWAVWAMNCELSTGSIGFWYLSWATSSLRNASFPSVVWASICVVAPSVGPAVGGGVVSSAIRAARRVTASMVTGVPFVPLEEQVEPAGDGRMDGANRGVALPVSGGPGAMRAADGSGRAALAGPAPAAGPDADATSGEAGVGQGRTQVGQGGGEEPAGGRLGGVEREVHGLVLHRHLDADGAEVVGSQLEGDFVPAVAPPVQRDDSRHDLVRHRFRGGRRRRVRRGGDGLGGTGGRGADGGRGGGLQLAEGARRPAGGAGRRWGGGGGGGRGVVGGEGGRRIGVDGGDRGGGRSGRPRAVGVAAVRQHRNRRPRTVPAITAGQHRNRRPRSACAVTVGQHRNG